MTHHLAAGLFELLDGIALGALVDDIREHGLLEPIVLYEGKVLDGRNRLAACELAGVEPRFVEWQEHDQTPTEFVLSMNLHRRHLTTAQRAALALDLLPRLEEEAKERQGMRTDLELPPENGRKFGKATEQVAAMVNVGHTTIESAKTIQERNPEIINRMRAGELNLAQAAREAGFVRHRYEPPLDRGVRNKDGRIEPIYYGKGDKFHESITPAVRYFRAWRARDFRFTHVGYKEARKRLKVLDQLAFDIERARADLVAHSDPIKQTV